jgi:hypothetical protein
MAFWAEYGVMPAAIIWVYIEHKRRRTHQLYWQILNGEASPKPGQAPRVQDAAEFYD